VAENVCSLVRFINHPASDHKMIIYKDGMICFPAKKNLVIGHKDNTLILVDHNDDRRL